MDRYTWSLLFYDLKMIWSYLQNCLLVPVVFHKMGRTFYEHMGGKTNYACRFCKLAISNIESRISTGYQSSTGLASFFKKAITLLKVK